MRRLVLCIGALCAQGYPSLLDCHEYARFGGRIMGQLSAIGGELYCTNCTGQGPAKDRYAPGQLYAITGSVTGSRWRMTADLGSWPGLAPGACPVDAASATWRAPPSID